MDIIVAIVFCFILAYVAIKMGYSIGYKEAKAEERSIKIHPSLNCPIDWVTTPTKEINSDIIKYKATTTNG